MRIYSIINLATKIAMKSKVRRGKVGAVLYLSSGKVLTYACNTTIYGDERRKTIHAEEYTILKANRLNIFKRFYREDINMLVVRYKKSGGLGNAKPCSNCSRLLSYYKIKNINYSNERGLIE